MQNNYSILSTVTSGNCSINSNSGLSSVFLRAFNTMLTTYSSFS